jgi:predicted nucleotidyltransferase
MGVVDKAALYGRLPERTRRHLADLVAELARVLGRDLVSVVVHGSAVRGGFRDNSSDVDLLVILADDRTEHLRAISNALILARAAARIEAMLVREDELHVSADVFPLLYRDIQQGHALLHGRDVLGALVFDAEHLRLRIEQELREARIRLRRMVVDEGGDPADMVGMLERKVKQLRSPLHALLALCGAPAAEDVASVFRAAGTLLDVGTAPLLEVASRPAEALTAARTLLDRAVTRVDALELAARKKGAPV